MGISNEIVPCIETSIFVEAVGTHENVTMFGPFWGESVLGDGSEAEGPNLVFPAAWIPLPALW